MYTIGDQVVYGIHGVCHIVDVEQRTVDKKKIDYFVLRPLRNLQTQYYIPVHNEAALAKLRPLITKETILHILGSESLKADCWIPEENRRKLRYKELVSSGDFAAILQMVHTLRKQKRIQMEAGKKFHQCDENFLRDAENILHSELSVVLQISQQEAEQFLKEQMNE